MIGNNLTNAIFSDLLYVGTKKAMGYLPFSTIKMYGGIRTVQENLQKIRKY